MLKFVILGIVALSLGVTPGVFNDVPQNERNSLLVETKNPRAELEDTARSGAKAIKDVSIEGINDISAVTKLLLNYLEELAKATISRLNYVTKNPISPKWN